MNFRSLLAVGALLAASSSAFAVSGTAATGELVLGFGASGGTGSSLNLEVALGTISTYTAPAMADGQLHLVGRLSGADLVANYGADWNTRSDLNWGIIGFTGNALNNTIWASSRQSVVGTQSTPWVKMAASQGNTAGSPIKSTVQGLTETAATSNSNYSAVLETSVGRSWYLQQGTTGSAFKTPYETATFNNSTVIAAGSYVVSDLYQMVNTSAGTTTYIGSFGIDNAGDLWFASSASAFAPATPGPVITAQPAPQTKAPGENASFTVVATGTGTLTYKWQKLQGAGDFADIVADVVYSTVTTPTLTLTAVTLGMNDTNYRCVVTDTAGSKNSDAAKLSVSETPVAPTITTQPVSLTRRDGGEAIFTVVATGTAPLTYQWQMKTTSVDWTNVTNAGISSGATTATLTLTPVAIASSGNQYRCVVTNAVGTATSNAATLSVTLPPVIVTQPQTQTVAVGATATFTGATTSSVALTYKWQVKTASADWTDLTEGAPYTGTTTTILTVAPATAAMNAYQFRFVVTDGAGGSNSNAAVLTVGSASTAPSITTQPASTTKIDGDSASFTVVATGTAPLAYQWQWKSAATAWANIPATAPYTGATSATLTIDPVTMAVSGNEYRCTVSNATAPAAVSDIVTLTVTAAPVAITVQPASKSVVALTNTTFSVTATGTAPLAYKWQVTTNGTAWTDITNAAPYSTATTATLTITAVPSTFTGYGYRCVVSNATGDVTSATAVLTVTAADEPIAIVTQPSSIAVTQDSPATFTVTVTGTSPVYQWQKGGTAIPGATSSSYTITSVAAAHAGTYNVVVHNSVNSVTSVDATLTVKPKPVIVTQPVDTSAALGNSATLTVGATGDGLTYRWFRGGVLVTGASASSLAFTAVAPADAGIYECLVSDGTGGEILSKPVVLGVTLPAGTRTAGLVSTYMLDIQHPLGQIYDQFLLTGAEGTFSAAPNKIARMSFLDGHDSIVQVEMSGAGAITVGLTGATGPIDPTRYTQTGIQYMKGKATVILAGADATTHFTIYSVGTFTNPGVTRADGGYYGWADVAVAAIISTNGGLGGIHQGNVEYNAAAGYTGLYAPSVTSVAQAPVIHDIDASGTAQPYLYFGPTGQVTVKIAGGDLKQTNDFNITVSGLLKVEMVGGQSSNGALVPGQLCQDHLVDDAGVDRTTALIVGP